MTMQRERQWPWVTRMLGCLLAGVALSALTACGEDSKAPTGPEFSGPWHQDVLLGINQALVQHHIKGCGIYKWKESAWLPGKYVVWCSTDLKHWKEYEVWAASSDDPTGDVVGPSKPNLGLPSPKQ